MITAQDKILYVANKLGLTSLKDMQGSTGAVYDVDNELSGQIFSNAARHQNPAVTNISDNQFEVNEALLIETIAFYTKDSGDQYVNIQNTYGSNAVIMFDLVIGNKRVMKDTPIFCAGSPYTFANTAQFINQFDPTTKIQAYLPRQQIFMEGAGILIPPQVQWSVNYKIYDWITGNVLANPENTFVGCYLYGTRVLLNFNTTI